MGKEGSLDVASEEVGQGEGCYRQGGNGAVQDVMEPATHTLEEVMNMEFESPEAAIRFYETVQ
ncbi:hypothetical protein PIB30_025444 [Stylosanthes scabra]|uniref:Uncharacterized protein n=1 Tax=Stylosanthes scabra TaxID=79078 RepID=A0ABU6U8V6_9FABA|nr:hypothetical protein [Stylosanthes scabra]